MMIERNEFRVKFGRMKEAKAIWLELLQALKPEDGNIKVRMLTDLTGPAYTLVLELELKDFMHHGVLQEKWKSNSQVAVLYKQFTEICDSSERVLYHIEFQS